MKKKSYGEIFIGLAVLAVGAGLFADALGYVEFGRLLATWWPLAVIGVGLLSLLSNPRMWWWPSAILLAGVLLLLNRLGVVDVNVARLIWPTIIIGVGLAILFERGATRSREVGDNEVNAFVAFSGNDSRSTAQAFRGGKITALFGGVVLDLNDAKLAKDGADIEVFTAFGGVEIKVPEGWVVKAEGMPILGGWENKTKAPKDPKNAPVMRVHGTCFCGGFGIKNGRTND